MTATIPLPVPTKTIPETDAPRKRRRRAPASGAADDCFACSKRNVKCDRRRPYCSPCLEVGSECSGYKTQLTWGVGVASRGKLRGLSLPVAKSAPVSKSPPRTYRQRATTTNKAYEREHDIEIKIEGEPPLLSPYTNYDFVHMNPNLPSSPAPSDWSQPEQHLAPTDAPNHGYLLRQSLSRLQPPMMRYGEDLMSSSIGSLSAYSDTDYSPIAQSFDEAPYMSPIAYEYAASPIDHAFGTSADQRAPTSCPDHFYAGLRSPPSHQSFDVPSPSVRLSNTDYDDDFVGSYEQNSEYLHVQKWESEDGQNSSIPPTISFGILPDVSPRLSFYLNYYEKIICPITVAIDSPSNPYRQHVLSLAAESQSMQHAICALASCNLRTRRRQSLGQFPYQTNEMPLDDASVQEEYHHRSLAVSLLNAQLSNPALAKHDSVLATLLMLCHYRMCETGIAQFKTQFAGVRKLLGIREAAGVRNCGWMESIFTFFDAITASVNDREAQLGGHFDVVNPCTDGSPLENLAGCDGRLFRTIAQLGRLNMLARDRPVDTKSAQAPPPMLSPMAQNTPVGEFFCTSPPSSQVSSSPPPDSRQQFWHEWREIRQALQSWTFMPELLSLPVAPSADQIRDFGFVSEAFRHAALLYTERLANPGLPSSDLAIQQHVSQVLFYVTSLGSSMGKFLLWPLFIAGSEAVGEVERGVVRDRCLGISRRGGYANNLAGLDVLEKVWREGEMKGFGWEKWMKGVDGEFIMV